MNNKLLTALGLSMISGIAVAGVASFDSLDTDKNGSLSPSEYQAATKLKGFNSDTKGHTSGSSSTHDMGAASTESSSGITADTDASGSANIGSDSANTSLKGSADIDSSIDADAAPSLPGSSPVGGAEGP